MILIRPSIQISCSCGVRSVLQTTLNVGSREKYHGQGMGDFSLFPLLKQPIHEGHEPIKINFTMTLLLAKRRRKVPHFHRELHQPKNTAGSGSKGNLGGIRHNATVRVRSVVPNVAGVGVNAPQGFPEALSFVDPTANEGGLEQVQFAARQELILNGDRHKIGRHGFQSLLCFVAFESMDRDHVVGGEFVEIGHLSENGNMGARGWFETR
mmetsp:Transcript_4664/g.13011  ORF Transcript_4664/g.13011 Transcript_4664/m.13011 type:complete len:210 (+) Transcript_4664:421-1050(+)